MRQILTHLGLGFAIVIPLFGCDLMRNRRDQTPPAAPAPTGQPEASALVNYLNKNAQLVRTVQARVDMACKADGQSVNLGGFLACQKPRDFRLAANMLGSPAVDLGSNDQEFWYWISKVNPPHVYHCTYENLKTGKVRVPFPFQPDMVVTALGIADYDPHATYQVKAAAKTVELIQDTISPTGQAVKKITVFNRFVAAAGQPQVLAHGLRDAKGNLICQAHILRVRVDRATGATLPTKVKIEWPAQKVSMEMDLSDVQTNTIDRAGAARLFQRNDLKYTTYDLARGITATPSSFQRAGAALPRDR